jgi:inner membrane protein
MADLDVVAFRFGVPYDHLLGHRGLFHSLFFALVLGVGVTSVFFRCEPVFSARWFLFCAYFSFLGASHGLLDAFTGGGLGIGLFSPFDTTRYFFPWTPIAVSPFNIRAFFTKWGLRVMASELLWIWLPSAVGFLVGRIIHQGRGLPHP